MVTLVTGATGNVGSLVFSNLVQKGHPCVAAVRRPETFSHSEKARLFDFENPATFASALEGCSHLFLVRPPAIANVKKIMVPFLHAAKAQGVRHVVFLSILGAEKNPLLPHRQMEIALEGSDLAWTFLRAGFFMHNFCTTHLDDIRIRRRIFLPAGDGRTSFVDVRDLGLAAARILSEPGHERRAYSLTGPEALTYHDVASIFSDVLGTPITYHPAGPFAFLGELRNQGIAFPMSLVMLGIYLTARFGLAGRLAADELRALVGREPLSFRKFVEDHRALWDPQGRP